MQKQIPATASVGVPATIVPHSRGGRHVMLSIAPPALWLYKLAAKYYEMLIALPGGQIVHARATLVRRSRSGRYYYFYVTRPAADILRQELERGTKAVLVVDLVPLPEKGKE